MRVHTRLFAAKVDQPRSCDSGEWLLSQRRDVLICFDSCQLVAGVVRYGYSQEARVGAPAIRASTSAR